MSQTKKDTEGTVSSIIVDDFNSSVPGVTMLLNPQVILEREAARQKLESTETPPIDAEPLALPEMEVLDAGPRISILAEETPASEPEVAPPLAQAPPLDTPLSRLGVWTELHFEENDRGFCFVQAIPHAHGKIEAWQEAAYRGMKLELDVLGISISFQEFSTRKDPFQTDAFCTPEGGYVQTVRSREHSNRLYVLVTSRSLLMEKEQVYTALEGSGEKESDDGGSIEIDFAS